MSDGRKRILSPFTERKKWKAWNNTREKYVPVKRRQSLVETGRGSYYKQERYKNFETVNSHFTMVMKVIK